MAVKILKNIITQTLLVILSVVVGLGRVHSSDPKPKPLEYLNFSQTLDHFGAGNLSNIKFNQTVIIDNTYWGGKKSNSPMLVFFGGENPISTVVQNIATINQGAPKFKALVLYIEHRFYGDSIPFGDIDIALEDSEVRGCLTSAQALMDFAEIIQTIKNMKFLRNNTPIVVMGCSYSGMLAVWFRLKFPHIATGAFASTASSAPIFYFDMDQPWDNDFCDVVSRDYKDCYDRIKKSWEMIDNMGSRTDGYEYLNKIFNTCSELIQRQGCGNNTMFQPRPFNLSKTIDYCTSKYNVRPRLNWVSTYYGGKDMRSTLKYFGSNILFSNGLMDPYSPFGVLKDISKSVVALTTKKGSHCLDVITPLKDDPKWLKYQRARALKIISKWIKNNQSYNNSPKTWFIWFGITLVFVLSH